MSGPQRSLSSLIDEIRGQTADLNAYVERMRAANRRLTGSTGETPTKIGSVGGGTLDANKVSERPPLMVELTMATELLNQARSNLQDEISYFESLSETGQPTARDVPEPAESTGRYYR